MTRIPRPRKKVGWLNAVMAAGIAVNSVRLRRRLARIPVLPDGAQPATTKADDVEFGVVSVEGVELDDATFNAAVAHARRLGLAVVDLVPGDLPVEEALDVARMVEPAYRTKPLAAGRGALHAAIAEKSLLERAGLADSTALDPVEMSLATIRLKQFAPRDTDLAVAPALKSVPMTIDQRLAYLRTVSGIVAPAVAAGPIVEYGLMALAAASNPFWALAAAKASIIQPYAVFAGGAIKPRDLSPARAAWRPVRMPIDAVRALRGRWESRAEVPTDPRATESRRPIYDELLADGLDRFFEEPRSTCPLCGSSAISTRVTTKDLLQHKPGTFRLDQCADCGHIFQNPRLSIEGLDFYYRDFYDGLGGGDADFIFSASDTSYRGRARMVARAAQPKRWLDVGGGHGHFCLIAAEELPDTRFDGLDMSESIDEAAARGWVETGHRGMFPDLAPDVAGSYDVVSMHHYLEHTRDPLAELDAARTALEPGGHLLIELPNPESFFGQVFGRYWMPWFQPQHQHFLTIANLSMALEDRGFEVVDVEVGESHQAVDIAFFFWLLAQYVAPPPTRPWLPPRTTAQRATRAATFSAAGATAAVGLLLDQVTAPAVRRAEHGSNTFRLLARRT